MSSGFICFITEKIKLAKLINNLSDQTIIKLTSLASSKTECDVWAGKNMSN